MATVSLRISDDDLAVIDLRAGKLGVTRTAYMLRTMLGRATAEERRLDEFEDRLARVEAALFE